MLGHVRKFKLLLGLLLLLGLNSTAFSDGPFIKNTHYQIFVNGGRPSGDPPKGIHWHTLSWEKIVEFSRKKQLHETPLHEKTVAYIIRENLQRKKFKLDVWTDSKGYPSKMAIGTNVFLKPASTEKPRTPPTRKPPTTNPPPPRPEGEYIDPESLLYQTDPLFQLTLSFLSRREVASVPKNQRLTDLLSYAIRVPLEETQCSTPKGKESPVFHHKNVRDAFVRYGYSANLDLSQDEVRQAIVRTASRLRRSLRREVFFKTLTPNHCLVNVFKEVWNVLLQQHQKYLVWDFRHWLVQAHRNRRQLKFDDQHIHHYRIDDPVLKKTLQFLESVLTRVPNTLFLRELSPKFRQWATYETNSNDPNSRKQPIDILTLFIKANRYPTLTKQAEIGTGTAIFMSGIQNFLAPKTYPPRVTIAAGKFDDARRIRADYYVFCSSSYFKPYEFRDRRINRDAFLSYFLLSKEEAETLRDQKQSLYFSCGHSTKDRLYVVPKSATSVKVPLKADRYQRFEVGEDLVIKALGTYPLIDSITDGFIASISKGISRTGFFPTGKPEPIDDLRALFKREFLDSDFYIQANYLANASRLLIGYRGSKLLTLRKRTNGITRIFRVVIPPQSTKKRVKRVPVYLSDKEIADLFIQRRRLRTQRRLTVLNVKCSSAGCVRPWVKAYALSLNRDDRITANQTKALSKEIPLIIGSDSTFKAGSTRELLSHTKYPFDALKTAAEQERIHDLLASLTRAGFKPNSNYSYPQTYNVNVVAKGIHIEVRTATGERISY